MHRRAHHEDAGDHDGGLAAEPSQRLLGGENGRRRQREHDEQRYDVVPQALGDEQAERNDKDAEDVKLSGR